MLQATPEQCDEIDQKLHDGEADHYVMHEWLLDWLMSNHPDIFTDKWKVNFYVDVDLGDGDVWAVNVDEASVRGDAYYIFNMELFKEIFDVEKSFRNHDILSRPV